MEEVNQPASSKPTTQDESQLKASLKKYKKKAQLLKEEIDI